MRATRNEKGVLKLVHPGRYIEIHREPIMAEEIMRRNPRHCITRPDVFQFPWIVVKPESVLLPGRVFFIVPYHTIYKLIKSKAPSFQNQHFSHDLSSFMNCSSDLISTKNRQSPKQLFYKRLPWKMCLSVTSPKQSRVQVRPKGIRYRETHILETQKHLQDEESSNAETREESGKESSEKDDFDFEFQYEQVTMLRSCLRKPDSNRRLLNLKVSFDLANKEEEEQGEYNKVLQSFLGAEISDDSNTSK
ncbi:hypothetical protein QN277_023299 [Acacia crassicarpa]|uniref:Uncharacterized protein n=1 Tax=Acacia crassicarpa TaxID=499986 RepID=A0AAE1JKZ5_9FABA|nr:hypothetical protein QN277_023299 [Acacia crassicarpa]